MGIVLFITKITLDIDYIDHNCYLYGVSNAKKSPFIRDIERYKADSESIRAKLCSEATEGDVDFHLEDPFDYSVPEENILVYNPTNVG